MDYGKAPYKRPYDGQQDSRVADASSTTKRTRVEEELGTTLGGQSIHSARVATGPVDLTYDSPFYRAAHGLEPLHRPLAAPTPASQAPGAQLAHHSPAYAVPSAPSQHPQDTSFAGRSLGTAHPSRQTDLSLAAASSARSHHPALQSTRLPPPARPVQSHRQEPAADRRAAESTKKTFVRGPFLDDSSDEEEDLVSKTVPGRFGGGRTQPGPMQRPLEPRESAPPIQASPFTFRAPTYERAGSSAAQHGVKAQLPPLPYNGAPLSLPQAPRGTPQAVYHGHNKGLVTDRLTSVAPVPAAQSATTFGKQQIAARPVLPVSQRETAMAPVTGSAKSGNAAGTLKDLITKIQTSQPRQVAPTAVMASSVPGSASTISKVASAAVPKATKSVPGPVALNSAAGIEALQRKSHDRKLGKITVTDIQLLAWKSDGLKFSAMVEPFAKSTGISRTAETLRKRHNQVEIAVNIAKVTSKLKEDVLHGVAGAEDRLNALVQDALLNSGQPIEDSPAPVTEPQPARVQRAQAAPAPAIPTNSPLPTDPTNTAAAERPATGGKKPTWALLEHLLSPEETEESDAESEASQDPEGFWHFEYQVQRRQCTIEQIITDGMTINGVEWEEVGEPHLKLKRANAQASGSVLFMRLGTEPIVLPSSFNTSCMTDEECAVHCQMESPRGVVQTRVVQRTRLSSERIGVPHKRGWLPRTLYHTKQRITTQVGALFEAREDFVNPNSSADRAWANACAIDQFVRLTHQPKTANLHHRDFEIAQQKEEVAEAFARTGDKLLFSARQQMTNKLVEVWAEEGRLIGPRNLL